MLMLPISEENLSYAFNDLNKKLTNPIDFDNLCKIFEPTQFFKEPSVIMNTVAVLFNTVGVDSIKDPHGWVDTCWQDTLYLYVNMGDEYLLTLFYDTRKRQYFISDLVGVLEEVETLKRNIERKKE